MADSSFDDRIQRLEDLVGVGDLIGMVTYDQVYAFNQHEGYWINFLGKDGPKTIHDHPGGGQGKFLTVGLTETAITNCQRIADHLLDDEEGSLIRAMADSEEATAARASLLAPIEFGDLKESDHPQVFDNGDLVYDRPPAVPRLSREALDAKGRLTSPHHGGSGERTYLDETNPRYGKAHHEHGGPHLENPEPTVDWRSETSHQESDDELRRNWQDSRYLIPNHRYEDHRTPEQREAADQKAFVEETLAQRKRKRHVKDDDY